METTMGFMGTTIRIHSFIPSEPKVRFWAESTHGPFSQSKQVSAP